MSCSYTVKTGVEACLVVLKFAIKLKTHALHESSLKSSHTNSLFYGKLNSNFCCVVSGHIDVHSNIKRFDSISYLASPFLTKP